MKRTSRMLTALVALSLVVAACGDDDDDSGGATETTAAAGGTETTAAAGAAAGGSVDGVLKIGTLLPQTGGLAILGPPMIEGVRMALRDINAAGGILGKDVAVVETDDGTNVDVAGAAVDQLLNADQVDAIVGAAGSSITLAVIDRITGAQRIECSPSNTGASFTTYDDGGYYFRTAPPDSLQGPALANVVVEDGHSNIVLIGQATEYGEGFVGFLDEALTAAGATVAATIVYDPAATSFDAEVQQIVDADPDAVVLISYAEGIPIIQAMIEQGVGPDTVGLYIADGLASGTLGEKIDPANPGVAAGIRGTQPSAAPENGAAFFPDAFAEFAPDIDVIYSGHAYDCVAVIALAAAVAGTDDPVAIQAEMNGVTSGGEKCDTVAACLELVAAGTDIDYDGAAGPLEFSEAGEPAAGTYDIYEYDADGVQQVEAQVIED